MNIPSAVVLWKFGGVGADLRSENNYQNNKGYRLKCTANNKYLVWDKGHLSVNLAFSNEAQHKYHFHLPDGKERVIRSGETVAMAIGSGEAYLYYGHQKIGINLKWSTKPVYQWRIYGADGKAGVPLKTGTTYALLNEAVEPDPDFMIHMNKYLPGIVPLGWTSTKDWLEELANRVAREAAKKAVQALMTA
ncbi:MAG: hypothetical protein SGJ11_11375 [Phycisphaerae bacterium]|nr:hypothetical protein [Phycisphaerae bacterium]